MVPRQTGLVARLARDVATGDEQVTADRVDVASGDHSSAGRLDRFDGRVRRQHREDPERREDASLIGSIGVDIDDQRRAGGAASRRSDGSDDRRDATGVVPMPMRQEEHVDAGQVDGEPLGVGEPDVTVGSHVKQHRCRALPLPGRGKCREAVTCHAEMVEGDNAVMPVVLPGRWDAHEQVGQLGELRNARIDARERVGRVVDDDGDGELVELEARFSEMRRHRRIIAERRFAAVRASRSNAPVWSIRGR